MGTFTSEQLEDTQYNSTQHRFQQELERGQVAGDDFITASGAKVPMFQEQDDDNDLIDPGCVYCEGEGVWYEDDRSGHCQACRGTGKAGYQISKGEQRKNQWLDMIFFTDAPRFELMERDICPECQCGGCGGECQFTEEDWAECD